MRGMPEKGKRLAGHCRLWYYSESISQYKAKMSKCFLGNAGWPGWLNSYPIPQEKSMKTFVVIAASSMLALAAPAFAQTAGSAGGAGSAGAGMAGSNGTASQGSSGSTLSNPGMNPTTPPATGTYEGRATAPDSTTGGAIAPSPPTGAVGGVGGATAK